MAAFNKINDFVNQLGKGVIKLHAAGDTINVMLTNTVPVATNTILSNITEITTGNGYSAGGSDTQNDYTTTSGTGSCTGVNVVWTASGGSVGPFRYVVLYDTTPTTPLKPLIGWWDYGSAVTLNSGDSFTVSFGASMFTLA